MPAPTCIPRVDSVQANIDGAAQASADIQFFQSRYADPAFLRDRMAELFRESVPQSYRDGYLRAVQKVLERSS